MKKCLVVLSCALSWNGFGRDLASAQAVTPLKNRVVMRDSEREVPAGAFPTPPQQNAPWLDERHDAFSQVVARLFAAGLADPRGCDYREVEFAAGPARFLRMGEKSSSERAFVLPLPDGAPQDAPRYAVAWNGQIYRVWSVGAPQDWRADLARMADNPHRGGRPYEMSQAVETDSSTPRILKAVLAERLGAPRRLFSEISLAGAAESWFYTLSNRAENAHLRGDDAAALSLLQQKAAATSALRDVFDAQSLQSQGWLLRDDALFADQKRRALEAKNGPFALADRPIARLIWNLQNLRASQMIIPGDVDFGGDASFQTLVALGAAAVPALLDAVESDDRLTRSAQSGSGFSFDRQGEILPVSSVAFDALMQIWGVGWDARHQLFDGRDAVLEPIKRTILVRKLRAYAQKYAGKTGLERQFAVLSDDAATPTQWLDAMRAFNAPTRPAYRNGTFHIIVDSKSHTSIIDQDLTPRGIALKNRTAPSVSDLAEKRALETARRAWEWPVEEYQARYQALNWMEISNHLVLEAAKWDLPRALPLLKTQAARVPRLVARVSVGAPAPDPGLLGIASDAQTTAAQAELQFFAARRKSALASEQHAAALDYATWLQKQSFGWLESEAYAPIWRFPDEPSLQNAAQVLFGAPRKPFEELLLRVGQHNRNGYNEARGFGLIDTPLLATPAFRGAVLRELSNTTPAGTLHFRADGQFSVEFRSGDSAQSQILRLARGQASAPNGSSIRVADIVARRFLGRVGPESRTRMLEFWWPQARRDAAIARLKTRLQNGIYSFDPNPVHLDF